MLSTRVTNYAKSVEAPAVNARVLTKRGTQRSADIEISFLSLWKKGIQVGYDGSLLDDGDCVYLLDVVYQQKGNPIQRIDYFHGFDTKRDEPIAQLFNEGMGDFGSSRMINLTYGFTVTRIKNFQRRWRRWRLKRIRIVFRSLITATGHNRGIFRLHTVSNSLEDFICS